MIVSKTVKIKEFITLFNTICYKNVIANIFIEDSNKIIQTWNANTSSIGGQISDKISDFAVIPLDRFPYMITNCVCLFSYDDYGGDTKIITISNGAYYIKSYTINLHSNIFYDLTLVCHDNSRLRSSNC